MTSYNPDNLAKLVQETIKSLTVVDHPELSPDEAKDFLQGYGTAIDHTETIYANECEEIIEGSNEIYDFSLHRASSFIKGIYSPFQLKSIFIILSINEEEHAFQLRNLEHSCAEYIYFKKNYFIPAFADLDCPPFLRIEFAGKKESAMSSVKHEKCISVLYTTVAWDIVMKNRTVNLFKCRDKLSTEEALNINKGYIFPDFNTGSNRANLCSAKRLAHEIQKLKPDVRLFSKDECKLILHDVVIEELKIAFSIYLGHNEYVRDDTKYIERLHQTKDKGYYVISLGRKELENFCVDVLANILSTAENASGPDVYIH